jgi:hypothetical protein
MASSTVLLRTFVCTTWIAAIIPGCSSKAEDTPTAAAVQSEKPVAAPPAPAAPAPAAPAPAGPAPAPAAAGPVGLGGAGIGGVRDGFSGGLAELRAALPGMDVQEAIIDLEEGETSPGFQVRQAKGRDVLFTLIAGGGSIFLEALSPELRTADGLHVGSTFEELAAVKQRRSCKGFIAEGYRATCSLGKGSLVYEFLNLDGEPKKGKALDRQLKRQKIAVIRWVGKGTLATTLKDEGGEGEGE